MADGSFCGEVCAEGQWKGPRFSMAFQPIIDLPNRQIVSHEALVRGSAGQGAGSILSLVTPENRYSFDQTCRVRAIELSSQLGLTRRLNINFMPNAVYRPEACIRKTLAAARRVGMLYNNLTFEIVEDERISDHQHLSGIVEEYRRHGFRVALDDFGSGASGLNLLAAIQPDIVKLDMALIRDIHLSPVKQKITAGMIRICQELHVDIVAEGVEQTDEMKVLADYGVTLFQGYLFAKPAFEKILTEAEIWFPGSEIAAAAISSAA